MHPIPKLWAIIQFKPNAHKLAERNLNQQDFKTFLPFEEVTQYQNQQFTSIKRPLFPGYMFVALEKVNTPWHKINSTYGVSKLLINNNKPYIIPDSYIDAIIEQCNKEGVFIPHKKISKNDRVRLVSGPFSNFLATVDSIDKNNRIWIFIDLMGQATRTLVKAEKLKHAL